MYLRSKLTLTIVLLILVMGVLSLFTLTYLQEQMLTRKLVEKGDTISHTLAASALEPFLTNDLVQLQQLMDLATSNQEVKYAYITDAAGMVVIHTFPDGFPQQLKEVGGRRFKTKNGERIRDFQAPMFQGIGTLHLGLSENSIQEEIAATRRVMLLLTLLGMLIGGTLSYLLGRRLTRPLGKLVEGTREIEKGNLDHQLEVQARDELGELALAFNQMTRQLKARETQLRERNQELEILNEIASILASPQPLTRLLPRVTEYLGKITGSSRCVIALFDPTRKKRRLKAEYCAPGIKTMQDIRIPVEGNPHYKALLESAEPLASNHDDPLLAPVKHLVDELEIKSMLATTIKSTGSVIGVIALHQCDRVRNYTENDKRLLKSVSRQLALSLESSMFLDEIIASQERYYELYENATDIMLTHKRDGSIISVNREGLKTLGYTWQEVTGLENGIYDLLTHPSKKELNDALQRLEPGEALEIGLEFVTKKGHRRLLECRMRLLTENDGDEMVHTIARDITEKIEMQQSLLESHQALQDAYQELEHLNRLKDELLSNISHELRTPLTVIQGHAELLLEAAKPEEKKHLEAILRNTERLKKMINSLLDVSRETKLKKDKIKLKTLVDRLIEDITPYAREKNLEIEIKIPENLEIEADPDRFTQAITNLLNNYIKYTEKGKITLTAMEERDTIHLTIRDTGTRMPDSQLEKIFKPHPDNSGISISIAQNIIQAHGGVMWTESGNGIKIHILVPKEK